ncbi:T-complex protein 1, zeta SU [Guillardia theta]|uniref:T-complex protein 1, zeta SU n=1 Tax=Guillardia theta TaxID=55529 RepID=Q9AW35_GUITH|nr:T-complex protein 1, zeta SU [Guillardia theta]CAC27036.1 T-complex protein 1, zeta SU [Guillardia theta]|mmetsp:Transcript_9081/g.30270  ORF Transcript_9081/g.30270 Transcript_9081/m.30270 type:complete len:525 (-) Transcript_9081:2188-3762(-)
MISDNNQKNEHSEILEQKRTAKGICNYLASNSAKGLYDILKTSLGPFGKFKMLISKNGDLKITKEGLTLFSDMQIQNPFAILISKSIINQKNFLGDGTLSIITLLGEMFKSIESALQDNIHPEKILRGINMGYNYLKKNLSDYSSYLKIDRNNIFKCALSVIGTKFNSSFSEKLSKIVTDSFMTIYRNSQEIDLNLIEILQIDSPNESDCKWIKGVVLDHGIRNNTVPLITKNVFILLINFNLEYEKTENNSSFIYKSTKQYEKFAIFEQELLKKKINKIIQIKRIVCKNNNNSFMVINQKGIDSFSLDSLAKENIIAVRRAKKKNLERISLLCNCMPINSIDDIKLEYLGFAGLVYEQIIGEDRYTFIENVTNPFSGTILIKGKSSMIRNQVENVLKNSLKSIKSFIYDKKTLPGGGFIECQLYKKLVEFSKNSIEKNRIGVIILANGLLGVPKCLFENYIFKKNKKKNQILNDNEWITDIILSNKSPDILDGYSIKLNILEQAVAITNQILNIDEIIMGCGI